jgi:hypothetical protein
MISGAKNMVCHNPGCMGNYDFDQIAFFARKRFIEGHNTVDLLQQAKSEREKEEIALVCLLDVADDQIQDLRLSCRYEGQCEVTSCREKLRKMIERELASS